MAWPLVLLHGFTQTGRSWDAVRGELGAAGGGRPADRGAAGREPAAVVVAPDLRGHGAAAARRPIDADRLVADVLAAAPPRFAVAGYSMGGRLALHVALAAPDRVTGLGLVSTTAGLEDAAERAARRAADDALADEIEAGGIAAFAARWAQLPLWAGQPEAVRAAAQAERRRQDPAGLAAALRGFGTGAMAPVWDRLGELTMPAVVLAGERDAKFRAIGERLAAALPGARLVVVRGAGHALTLEAPAAVAAQLAALGRATAVAPPRADAARRGAPGGGDADAARRHARR